MRLLDFYMDDIDRLDGILAADQRYTLEDAEELDERLTKALEKVEEEFDEDDRSSMSDKLVEIFNGIMDEYDDERFADGDDKEKQDD